MSYVLGICSNVHISSACLCKDGEIIAAIPEERLVRKKGTRKFPLESIRYCLDVAEINIHEVEYVSIANDVGLSLNKYDYKQMDVLRWYGEINNQIPMGLSKTYKEKYIGPFEQNLSFTESKLSLQYVSHHKAHMSNAFYLSPFKEAAVLTADGFGEDGTVFWGKGKDNQIEIFSNMNYPHSLGMVYGTITELLGYKHDGDEWKVMGMSARGDKNKYYEKMKKLIKLKEDGKFELELSYYNFYNTHNNCMYNSDLIDLLCEPVVSGRFEQKHFDIAAALQRVTEDVLLHMLTHLFKQTQCKNLVLGGGVFMNSLFNGKIKRLTPFKNIFISSCPDDSGLSIGAALYTSYKNGCKRRIAQSHNYYGPEYGNYEIKKTLTKYKLFNRYSEEPSIEAAKYLYNGKIVGWYQGRMEFGQRALGNRSILADPRDYSMKDKINESVKYRENYRPFAPAILENEILNYVDNIDFYNEAQFMSYAVPIKSKKRDQIAAVVHHDGTSRLQLVNNETNPRFYELIKEFKKLSGIGVVVNTSFNIKGEPIVCSPTDAIKTFYSSGLDVLIIGNFIVEK